MIKQISNGVKSKIIILSFILALGLVVNVSAQGLQQNSVSSVISINDKIYKKMGLQQSSISSVISAYRFYKDIDSISINVPTVVEIPFAVDFI